MDELFEVNLVMIMMFLLFISSFICGIVVYEMCCGSLKGVVIWIIIIFFFGVGFVGCEINEFVYYVYEGVFFGISVFWFGFFVLFGIYGIYVMIGIFWIIGILI